MAGANPSTAAGLERLHKAHVQRYAHICAHHEIQFHPLAFDTLGRAHKSSLPSWSGGRRQRMARKAVSNASSSSAARTCRRLFAAYTSLRGAFARLSRPSTGRVDAPPKWSRSPRPSNASCACTSTLTGSPLPARRRLATTSSTRLLRSTASSMRLCSPWATARRWSPTSTPFPRPPHLHRRMRARGG